MPPALRWQISGAEKSLTSPQTLRGRVLYHLKTAYLITKSDIKTTIFPATTFALAASLSGSLLTTNSSPTLLTILFRLPSSLLWTWSNLWLFNLANQRLPASILEDSINKPWRALPSGRLTPNAARYLLLCSIPLVYILTLLLGGRDESVILMVLTWIYNDLGAADENFFVRHINNALGFITFAAGATQVLCGYPIYTLNVTAYQWLAVIAAVITFTIQFQDMEDQEGDRERARKTLPIVLGDRMTRFMNSIVILAFSFIAPAFWGLLWWGYILPVSLGSFIAVRTLSQRLVQADRKTFKLWCLWLVGLYLLPLLKHPGGLRWY
jgi:4-hydroxybenzoate polyprenyltransferase